VVWAWKITKKTKKRQEVEMKKIDTSLEVSPEMQKRVNKTKATMAEFHKFLVDACHTSFYEGENILTIEKIKQARELLGIEEKFKKGDYKRMFGAIECQ
jgi:hypothetical protein